MIWASNLLVFRIPAWLGLASTSLLSVLVATSEPREFKSAAKHPEWLASMQEEIDALRSNQTWDLYHVLLVLIYLVQNGFLI